MIRLVLFLLAVRNHPCYPQIALAAWLPMVGTNLAGSDLGVGGEDSDLQVSEQGLGQSCLCHSCVLREAFLLLWEYGEEQ